MGWQGIQVQNKSVFGILSRIQSYEIMYACTQASVCPQIQLYPVNVVQPTEIQVVKESFKSCTNEEQKATSYNRELQDDNRN